jgi:hypothetical protein
MQKITFINENDESQTMQLGFDLKTISFDEALKSHRTQNHLMSDVLGDGSVMVSVIGVFEILYQAVKCDEIKYPTFEQQRILNEILLTYAQLRDQNIGFGYCFT